MAESRIARENYIVIQGWMVTELGLKGNELMVYAIIHGFSQNADCVFSGSLQYLADWIKGTKQTVITALKSLVEKGFIVKRDKVLNGVKFCEYHSKNLNGAFKNLDRGIQKFRPNNLEDNLDNNLDNPPVVINNDIPQGDGAKANDPDKPAFETFWAAYPRHTNKATARKAWEKLRLTSQEYASLLRAIEAQKQSPQWQRDNGQYIPHPSTWLNQRRWEDEIPAAQQTTTCTGDNIPVFDEEDMSRYGGKPIPRDWRKPWTGDE